VLQTEVSHRLIGGIRTPTSVSIDRQLKLITIFAVNDCIPTVEGVDLSRHYFGRLRCKHLPILVILHLLNSWSLQVRSRVRHFHESDSTAGS
jgi:hypothetical protein